MFETLILLALGISTAAAAPMIGPDYWVGLGRERDLQYSPKEYARQIEVRVGTLGAPGQDEQLVTLVVSLNGRDVCSISKAIPPPAPRRTTEPLAFQVTYPSPINGSPRGRLVSYTLVATVQPAADGAPNEDQNLSNNRFEGELKFPAGGKAQCLVLER